MPSSEDIPPTETSPLLAKSDDGIPKPSHASNGVIPNAAISAPAGASDSISGHGEDVEQQGGEDEDNGSKAKAEGMPEVKKRMKYILPAIAIGIFLSAGDQTIIVSSYGRIGSDLKALNKTSWIATAYFLTVTSFQPLYGKLSDIFGRKPCLLFGYAVFGLGCLFCGLARTMDELIAARAFAGVGGSAMTVVVSILLSDVVPLRERGKWQGYVNIIYASGAGFGAPLGGILADYIGWRWSFIGQAPLTLLAFIAVYFALQLPKRDDSHWKDKLRRVDFLGAFILVAAVFTLLLGLDRGSNVAWSATITIASLSISFPLFIIFVIVEMKVASEPFAPGHIIFERSLFASYLCNFFSFSGWLAALFYIPLYFQAVDGVSATQAGLRLLPSILCGVSGSLFAGYLMQHTGTYYWLTVAAYTFLAVGMVPVILFSGLVMNATVGIIIGMMICAFSNGIGVTSALIALISNSNREDQAIATACSYLFRALGSVVGVSLSSTVVQQSLRQHLQSSLTGKEAEKIMLRVRESLEYIKTLDPDVREVVRDSYARSTRAGFVLMLVILLASASANATISLSRYRPAVLFITGLAAAYGIYYIHNYVYTDTTSQLNAPSRSLRRRNAIRRRSATARRHAGEQPRDFAVPSAADPDGESGASGTVTGRRYEQPSYGIARVENSQGGHVEFHLAPQVIPTAEAMENFHGFTHDDALNARDYLERLFLNAMLAAEIPRQHTIGLNGPGAQMLRAELIPRGFSQRNIDEAIQRFDEGVGQDMDGGLVDGVSQLQPSDGRETVVDGDSEFSWRGEEQNPTARQEDQARREGYVHRGVTCNSCGSMPIRGIRYRCTNCIDFDLCETCEAMQVHPKTHLFYKVRIPAPFLGNPRQAQPVWYPGKPNSMPQNLPNGLGKRLVKETGFENSEIDALWDQFKCLASSEWQEDSNRIHMAIDRRTFDKCFVPNTALRPPPPNLIYDRMFAFYDTNGDGLIGFEEFIRGLASLNNKNKDERLRRVFQGYDIDGDGFVDRKDFLRMFRAFYALNKELTRDMVAGMEDDVTEGGGAKEVILSSQPISSAFSGESKRRGQHGDMELIDSSDEVVRESGNDRADRSRVIADAAERSVFGSVDASSPRQTWAAMFDSEETTNEALEEALEEALAQATRHSTGNRNGVGTGAAGEDEGSADTDDGNDDEDDDEWPPPYVTIEDVEAALGAYLAIQDIESRADRKKIREAAQKRMRDERQKRREAARAEGVRERWRRRQFYLDEEDGSTAPEGIFEDVDSEEEEFKEKRKGVKETDAHEHGSSRGPSPRSRSSSKVRFQDDVLDDNDYETRSNPSTSSRSMIVGERWGGYEIPEAEKDVGKEVLYEVTQQGFNELLDPLFKKREDVIMEAMASRSERKKWREQLKQFEMEQKREKGLHRRRPNLSTSVSQSYSNGHNTDVHASPYVQASTPSIEPFPTVDASSALRTAIESEGDSAIILGDFLPQDTSTPPLSTAEATVSPADIPADSSSQLLASSGYGTTAGTPEASTTSPNPGASAPRTPSLEESAQEYRPSTPEGQTTLDVEDAVSQSIDDAPDPTLPQHRPNSMPSGPAARLAFLSSSPAFAEPGPSPSRMKKLLYYDAVEQEAKARGGPARLNFKEFEAIMKGDKGRKLGFLGAWIEMASF
ncbi:MFS general substrate transporter [Xylona heveae TC161]|uniref:MFS general substrate transporter n=1 Tax=Xylona heveae (strain CBS 132557 / TC161) TaxID=1328760 RepID=A0A165JGY4_XYLHT|nr:MFS general substrate transporter [Xylona heveae TC161]KZF26225.1 MFS general substrate transporter [Xylona heveae TC161]